MLIFQNDCFVYLWRRKMLVFDNKCPASLGYKCQVLRNTAAQSNLHL